MKQIAIELGLFVIAITGAVVAYQAFLGSFK
jgi:hypothetical protein